MTTIQQPERVIAAQQVIIAGYKDLIAKMNERDIDAAKYLRLIEKAIKVDNTRTMALEHLDRYITNMEARSNAKA